MNKNCLVLLVKVRSSFSHRTIVAGAFELKLNKTEDTVYLGKALTNGFNIINSEYDIFYEENKYIRVKCENGDLIKNLNEPYNLALLYSIYNSECKELDGLLTGVIGLNDDIHKETDNKSYLEYMVTTFGTEDSFNLLMEVDKDFLDKYWKEHYDL